MTTPMMVHPVTGEPVSLPTGQRSLDNGTPGTMNQGALQTDDGLSIQQNQLIERPVLPNSYARFRLQEHIKILAKPKAVPICGPRSRELSNIVLEQ